MTLGQLQQYFALEIELEQRAPLHEGDAEDQQCLREYQALHVLFEKTFKDYGEGLIMDESAELSAAYERWTEAMESYRRSLEANTQIWSDICRYWHDRANALEAELKVVYGAEGGGKGTG